MTVSPTLEQNEGRPEMVGCRVKTDSFIYFYALCMAVTDIDVVASVSRCLLDLCGEIVCTGSS